MMTCAKEPVSCYFPKKWSFLVTRKTAQNFDQELLILFDAPRYDAAAAKLAWERTLAFFGSRLRTA